MEKSILAGVEEGGKPDQFVDECLSLLANANRGEALTQLKELLSKSTKRVNTLIAEQAKQALVDESEASTGTTYLELPDAQFFEPRGRFKTMVSSGGIHLAGKSAGCFVPWARVTHSAVVPASQTTKREGEDWMCLHLVPGSVEYNGKPLKNLLWNMSKNPGKPTLVVTDDFKAGGTESEVVIALVSHLRGVQVTKPRADLFQTVSQQAAKDAKSFLRCYKGTQEGVIYPLECGVLFVKPTMFLPAAEIAAITAGRGGGSGQTRYVDLVISTAETEDFESEEIEFTNIEREELPALQAYVKGFLEVRRVEIEKAKAMQNDGQGGAAANTAADGVSDEEEEDDDYDPNAVDSDADDISGSGSGGGSGSETDSEDESYASEGDSEDEINNEKENKREQVSAERGERDEQTDMESKSKVKGGAAAVSDDDFEALLRQAYQSSNAKRERSEIDPSISDTDKATSSPLGFKKVKLEATESA